ncbi:MAG: helix-turn-helix transcriptional regulator [Clostridia bacterium]|nr:helix-turn-helix transcriptional regulator [Clostridia bacterium]
MIKEYLKQLKAKGNYSWQDISKASGLPEPTIRKIFSGETADPRFETVVRLVTAMGGSLDKINEIEKNESSEKNDKTDKLEVTEESQMKALIAVKEVYEARIKDLKESSAEHLNSIKRDKKILTVAVALLATFLIGVLTVDLFVGSIGWFRY